MEGDSIDDDEGVEDDRAEGRSSPTYVHWA